jgi:hypothetical protein
MTENRELFSFKPVPYAREGIEHVHPDSVESQELKRCVDELVELVKLEPVSKELSRWPLVRLQCRSLSKSNARTALSSQNADWVAPVAWKWWQGYTEPAVGEVPPEPDIVVEQVSCKKLMQYLPSRAVAEKRAMAGARAFYISPSPQLVLCSDRLKSFREKGDVLLHELTHAYDVRQTFR